jgi:hypothetical protein
LYGRPLRYLHSMLLSQEFFKGVRPGIDFETNLVVGRRANSLATTY